jgi:hypothetical protein
MLTSLRHVSLHLVILILVIPTLALSDTSQTSPCERATYDAEHNIQRSYAMIQELYENERDLVGEYVACYEEITGIDLMPWDARNERIVMLGIGTTIAAIFLLRFIIAVSQMNWNF